MSSIEGCNTYKINLDGFKNYKKSAVRKYYCRKPLSSDETANLASFKDKHGGIDGEIAVDIYPRLLNIKSDLKFANAESSNSSFCSKYSFPKLLSVSSRTTQ